MDSVKTSQKRKKKRRLKSASADSDEQSIVEENSVISGEELSGKTHKKQLKELAEKDPEFYTFLKEQEADLLDFHESENEGTEENDEEELQSGTLKEEEEEEVDDNGELSLDDRNRRIVTIEYVNKIEQSLCEQEKPEASLVRRLIALFRACAARVGVSLTSSTGFTVSEGAVFDAIIRLCFKRLGKALYALLGVVKEEDENTKDPEKARFRKHYRRWKKYGGLVKVYLPVFLQFLNELQTADVIVYALVAVQELLDLYLEFPKLLRNLTKALIRIWSRKTEECRCAAFMAICKLVRIHKRSYTTVLKSCYMNYVSNVSSVTEDSLPLVTFMQMSFAELCLIYPDVCYQYAFVYIRQTAIHLRNALIAKRKELTQTVYNWQYVQCLYIWARVIGRAYRVSSQKDVTGIKELAYPLCQITTATMKLFPSLKYFPVRLHCLRILLLLQHNCKLYIPTLSLAVELLADALHMLKKKPSSGKGTLKVVDMKCTLKASAAHLENAGYRDAIISELFKLQMEAAHLIQDSCAFPDVIVPLDEQLKYFVKNCRNVEYARLFKSLRMKLNEQAKFIREMQSTVDVDLFQPASLQHHHQANAPFNSFYRSYKNVWAMKENANLEAKKLSKNTTKKSVESGNLVCNEATSKARKRRRKDDDHFNGVKRKHVPKISKKEDNGDDVVQDLVLSDFDL